MWIDEEKISGERDDAMSDISSGSSAPKSQGDVSSNLRFVALCLWHPDLIEKQQLLAYRCKEGHRNPNIGVKKGTLADVKKELAARSSARKELQLQLRHEPSTVEIASRVRSKKKRGNIPAVEAPPIELKRSARLQDKYKATGTSTSKAISSRKAMKRAWTGTLVSI
ncbi:hypothetical protein B0H17DRAFT_1130682 [Mycena rosella]|uniref:Uncharacterized protein n=1 Tax=Mycena rosella TaxID=1033263 RepID=A0AAD7DSH9_MYCRO|nr:hypothetical protein B0H17DRAFT_1130682 [Mycena rosella]